jgi:DNA polymerase III alpha subunit
MWNENNSVKDLEKAVLYFGPEILSKCVCLDQSLNQYLDLLSKEHLDYPIPKDKIDIDNWLIPTEYKSLDIEKYLIDQCPEVNIQRLQEELLLYKKNKMIPLLKTMKYLVDTLRKNNIVWGVGRGSSVASYALYLIGVHKIDSVKYNLPLEEFFKGE